MLSETLFRFTMPASESRCELDVVAAVPGLNILHDSVEHDRGYPADAFEFERVCEHFSGAFFIASSSDDRLVDDLNQFSLLRNL